MQFFAKLPEAAASDLSRLADQIVVLSPSFYAAVQFGPSGYDEGELADMRLVVARPDVGRPASRDDVVKVVQGLGHPFTDEDAIVDFLADGKVRRDLKAQGFDGYRGSEVIANGEYEVVVVWEPSSLSIRPEPEDLPDFAVRRDGEGGLQIAVETAAGREKVVRAARESRGTLIDEARHVLGVVLAGATGAEDLSVRADAASIVGPGGVTWDLDGFDTWGFVGEGRASLPLANADRRFAP